MFLSSFRFYSVGIVAEDKAPDTHEIFAIPIELIPDISGMLEAVEEEVEVSGKDAKGMDYSVKVTSSNVIKAMWLPMGSSNRITSPDLKKGEKVIITQMADADKFYWTTLGKDDGLRRLETIVYGWSATEDPAEELDSETNMYTLEISTDGKHITLKTTKANEEPFAYEINLDLAVGSFTIKDDDDNYITLNSEDCVITAKNKFDSEITIDQATIQAFAEELIETNCNGEHISRAPKMQFGLDDAVQPSVLGDNMAKAMTSLIKQINASQVIGNLGAPTSAIQAVVAVVEPDLESGGASYSKVNTNQ